MVEAHQQSVDVIIPIYNNEDTIHSLLYRLGHALDKSTYDVRYIMIDDCGQDNSIDMMLELSSHRRDLTVVKNTKNIGQQRSIIKGMSESTGDVIVVLDGDLQDDPVYLAEMIPMLKKSDSCFAKRSSSYQSRWRMVTSIIFKSLIRSVSRLHYRAGCYYCCSRKVINRLLRVPTSSVYSSYMVAHHSDSISYVDVHRHTSEGASGYNLRSRIRSGLAAFRCCIELNQNKR